MDAAAPRDLLAHFQDLDDPRGPSRWHRLDEMMVIAILAVLCGASGWTEVQQFAQSKLKWLKTFLTLPHGVPSHDTFGRRFAALDPVQLERCFIDWTAAVAQHSGGTLVAIDGKTIRRSFDHANKKSAVHMVSVFAHANRLVRGQLADDDGSGGKSNEINDHLKNVCRIEHSRHRSPVNFVVHLMAGLLAYTLLPSKPAIRTDALNRLPEAVRG